jgi:DNA-binding transcriptional ArsR family regulator
MSRGLGALQRKILDVATEPMTVQELADATGASPSSIRNAVAALRRRKLVCVRTGVVRWDEVMERTATTRLRVAGRFRQLDDGRWRFERAVHGLLVVSEEAVQRRVSELRAVSPLLSRSEVREIIGYA